MAELLAEHPPLCTEVAVVFGCVRRACPCTVGRDISRTCHCDRGQKGKGYKEDFERVAHGEGEEEIG